MTDVPFFSIIFPEYAEAKGLLYLEDPSEGQVHLGGVFNSFYPYDLATITGASHFYLSGSIPANTSATVWIHQPDTPSKPLSNFLADGNQFHHKIPPIITAPGQRLTIELSFDKSIHKTEIRDALRTINWGVSKDKEKQLVKLAIVMCTFNNDDLLLENVKSLVQSDIWSRIPAELIVVNNGGEDNPLQLHFPRVTQFKQKNSGGAGGFTRGIEEVCFLTLKERGFSHILLMDDDVKFHPEIIQRAIRFHEYSVSDNVIGASMLKLEKPTHLHEAGAIFRTKCALDAHTDVPKGDVTKNTLDFLGRAKPVHYNAWWFCSFSKRAVETVGLPLQIFIHGDDMEYGLRLRHHGFKNYCPGGLSLWHASFEGKPVTWIRYFNFRNALIRLLLQEGDMKNPPAIAPTQLRRVVKKCLIRNDYAAAAMVLRAYQDLINSNFDWHIDCYQTKISELNAEFESYMAADSPSQITNRRRVKVGRFGGQKWSHRLVGWLKYRTINLTFLAIPTLHVYQTKNQKYSWREVPFFSDVEVNTGTNIVRYPRNRQMALRIQKRLAQAIKATSTLHTFVNDKF